ncbi:hypothetical protein CRU99_11085, partial [Malaciobacter mytili]|uniref:hypothetical protein n=1 Tax=Malaciobacter mytili TaxID=603050 RepID=UPI00102711FE
MSEENHKETEIDLSSFFLVLLKNKLIIIIFTSLVTIICIYNIYQKDSIYQAKAVIKIGKHLNTLLDDSTTLSIELIAVFMNKNEKNATIEKILPMYNQKEFIEIVSEAPSNELAKKEINKVVSYIQQKHNKIFEDILMTKKIQLNELERRVSFINANNAIIFEEQINYKLDVEIKFLKNKILELETEIK